MVVRIHPPTPIYLKEFILNTNENYRNVYIVTVTYKEPCESRVTLIARNEDHVKELIYSTAGGYDELKIIDIVSLADVNDVNRSLSVLGLESDSLEEALNNEEIQKALKEFDKKPNLKVIN